MSPSDISMSQPVKHLLLMRESLNIRVPGILVCQHVTGNVETLFYPYRLNPKAPWLWHSAHNYCINPSMCFSAHLLAQRSSEIRPIFIFISELLTQCTVSYRCSINAHWIEPKVWCQGNLSHHESYRRANTKAAAAVSKHWAINGRWQMVGLAGMWS